MADPPSAVEGDDPRVARRARVIAHLLKIVDRQIGRGEEASVQEWSHLREMAAGYEGGLEAVAALESVVRKCEEQVAAKIQAGERDPERLRAGLVHFIRSVVRKKFGTAEDPAEAGTPEPLRSPAEKP
jgi:hypothetical protein